jgi:hypothetical protein
MNGILFGAALLPAGVTITLGPWDVRVLIESGEIA